MKLKVILAAVFSMILAAAVFAQEVKPEKVEEVKIPNFSGNWTLDMKKSKLKGKLTVEAMKMTVLQTSKNIKIETDTKFLPASDNKNADIRGGSGFGKGPTQSVTVYNYTLDGKETDYQEPGGIGNAKITGVIEKNGQMNLNQTRRIVMTTGEKVLKIYEIWTLSPDGKTLNVWRSNDVLKGDFLEQKVAAEFSEMVFTKK